MEARHVTSTDGETPSSHKKGQSALSSHAAVGAVILAGKKRYRLAE
jgi:hypothetical protein